MKESGNDDEDDDNNYGKFLKILFLSLFRLFLGRSLLETVTCTLVLMMMLVCVTHSVSNLFFLNFFIFAFVDYLFSNSSFLIQFTFQNFFVLFH